MANKFSVQIICVKNTRVKKNNAELVVKQIFTWIISAILLCLPNHNENCYESKNR